MEFLSQSITLGVGECTFQPIGPKLAWANAMRRPVPLRPRKLDPSYILVSIADGAMWGVPISSIVLEHPASAKSCNL
jgi:hypothetical protein